MKAVEIEMISSCLVGTTREITMSILELNTWDLRILPGVYTQRGFVFHNPKPQQLQQTLTDHLKNSLSKTLDFFPPLAGRLSTTAHDGDMFRFFLDPNNAGAMFTHAVADVSVSDLLEEKHTHESISSLFPLDGVFNYEGVSTPLLAVQVTELADGVFLGFATNHAVMDGASLWHFINSWSEIARGCDTISKLPVFERWFPTTAAADDDGDYVKRLVHLPTLKKNSRDPFSTPKKVFHVSRQSLAELKAKANSEAGTNKISSLQAVIAHLWRGTTRSASRDGSSGAGGESIILMSIGARERLSLPEGYFGNAFYIAPIAMSVGELLERGLGYAAAKINEFVSEQNRAAIIRNAEAGIFGRPQAALIIGSSPRYDLYGNDFGWGKPVALRSGVSNKPEGMVRVTAAAEAGGVDLEVYYAQEMLKALECDAEFMHSVTTSVARTLRKITPNRV